MDFKWFAPKNGLIGHRGLAGMAPENTLISFQTAEKHGLNWVEFDVQLSKDHQLVIFHDHFINRTTNGRGSLYDFTASELDTLDAGSWYDPKFKGVKVPILDKDLNEILKCNLHYNIELKCPNNPSELYGQLLTQKFTEVVLNRWPKNKPLPLVSSFEWELLFTLRKTLPDLPIGFLCDVLTPDLLRIAAYTPNCAIHSNYKHITSTEMNRLKTLNIPVLAYTVNDLQTANELLNQGVYAVFTDSLTQTAPNFRIAS